MQNSDTISGRYNPASGVSPVEHNNGRPGNTRNTGTDPVSGRKVEVLPSPEGGGILSRLKKIFSAIVDWFRGLFSSDKTLARREVRQEPAGNAAADKSGSVPEGRDGHNAGARRGALVGLAQSNLGKTRDVERKADALEKRSANYLSAVQRLRQEQEARIAANNEGGAWGKLKNFFQEGA